MNRLKGIIYDIVTWLASIGGARQTKDKRVLIIRLDEIGDYMLWRPFLKEIVQHYTSQGFQVDFVGNQSWKSLFDSFDKQGINQSFWMDKIRFKKELFYRFQFLRNLNQHHYQALINPTFSRDKRYDDTIVKAVKATESIGMVANQESVQRYELGYDKSLYTKLFDHPEKPIFEFLRNRLFTEFVTGSNQLPNNTAIQKEQLSNYKVTVPENYFLVFPGSRSKARIWPSEHFVQVSNFLFEQFGWTAVICGTNADAVYTNAFIEQYPHPILNLTGKTNLTEMLTVLSTARCLISVDTGSVHMAAAVNCPVFGIFNGSQFKRFAPYPKEVFENFYASYPDEVERDFTNQALVKQKYEFVVKVPYSLVQPEKLILNLHLHFLGK